MDRPDELLSRAVSDVVPRKLAEEKLKSGKPMRLYLGIDPTGAKLHLGHSVPLRKLKAFADAGYHAIFLIGSGTAMIGDPTGRDTSRPALTKEEIEKNFETYKEQASTILDFSKVEVRYNHEWLEKLSAADILRIASNFTVQQMLQRDMFKERMQWKVICVHCKEQLPSPIQFAGSDEFEGATLEGNTMKCHHCGKITPVTKENIIPPPHPVTPMEFLYPMMQGYDSVVLDVDFELGGNDQLFNMLCGRKLQKRFGKRDKCVITMKLLEGIDGRKMSKTYDNCIWLEDSPKEMYGKLLTIRDDLILTYLECVTEMPMAEIAEIKKSLEKGSNPKEAKMRLAREVVTLYHDAAEAEKAEEEFQQVFAKKGVPDAMPEIAAEKGSLLIDVLAANKMVSSKSEARRLIEQKGLQMNDRTVESIEQTIEEGIVKVGKRKFVRIIPR